MFVSIVVSLFPFHDERERRLIDIFGRAKQGCAFWQSKNRTSMSNLTDSQQHALNQLRELTNGGSDDVSISVLESAGWNVEVLTYSTFSVLSYTQQLSKRAAELIFGGGTGTPQPSSQQPASTSHKSPMESFQVDDSAQANGQVSSVCALNPFIPSRFIDFSGIELKGSIYTGTPPVILSCIPSSCPFKHFPLHLQHPPHTSSPVSFLHSQLLPSVTTPTKSSRRARQLGSGTRGRTRCCLY